MHTIVVELYFQIRRLHINLALKKKKKKIVMDICMQLKILTFYDKLLHLISKFYNNYAIVYIFYHLNLYYFNLTKIFMLLQ